MKTNVRVVLFRLGLIGLPFVVGCEEQQARVGAPPEVPFLLAAANTPVPDSKPIETKPGEAPTIATPVQVQASSQQSPLPATPAPIAPVAVEPDPDSLEAAAAPDDLNLSPALAEIIKLIQAGVGEEVLMTYITNSTEMLNIGSNEILYLHDLGTPPTILTTLIQTDTARKQTAAAVKPLPPGVALTTPATNIFVPRGLPQLNTNVPVTSDVGAIPIETVLVTNAPLVPTDPGVVEPPVEEPTDVSYFYTELAPYGAWVDVPDYGRCWRPTVAVWNSAWRPYADGGRWMWTASGWYWYSDYSWGWAPFHYGRWTCPAGVGWVWVPDVHWGPAWVSWRSTSSYCGWAPLPPHARFVAGHGFYHNTLSVSAGYDYHLRDCDYVFVPTSRFCDRRPVDHCVRPSHATTVFKESVVVNNYVTVNKTVINKGVGFERISKATRGNVRQVALKGTSDIRTTAARREVLEPDGKTVVVARPPASRPTINPPSRPISAVSHLRPRSQRDASAAPSVASVNSDDAASRPEPQRPVFGGIPSPRGGALAGTRGGRDSEVIDEAAKRDPRSIVMTSRAVNRASVSEAPANRSTPMAPPVANRGPFPVARVSPPARPEAPQVAGPVAPVERPRTQVTRPTPSSSASASQPSPAPRAYRPEVARPEVRQAESRSDSPSAGGGESPRSTAGRSFEVRSAPAAAPVAPSAPTPSAPSSARSEAYRSAPAPSPSAPAARPVGGGSSGARPSR